jgi:Tol biopolymer transport system component
MPGQVPRRPWQSAGDLLSELEWISETGSEAGMPAPVAAKRRSRDRMAWLATGVAAVLLVGTIGWIAVHLRNEAAPPAMVRFQVSVPDKMNTSYGDGLVISPDGQRIAFTASTAGIGADQVKLFVRPLNALNATEIATPGLSPTLPFWSPDGRQIAFSAGGTLQKVGISGEPPVTICNCNLYGGTWNRDGVILSTNSTGLLYRVSATGGDPKPLWPLAAGEDAQLWPQFLPDGKHYLYLSVSDQPGKTGIYVNSIDSNDRRFVVATDTNAAYAQGQLFFTRGDVLMAQPFDPGTLKLSGDPHPVTDHLERSARFRTSLYIATFSASPNGVLAWRSNTQSSQGSLQWFDRDGKKLAVVGEPADYSNPSLSPDDSKLAVCIRDPQTRTRNIWVFDLLRGTSTRLTFDPADNINPIWSPDGTRIAFTSDRSGQRNIYWKLADGSQPEELLLGGKEQENVEDWSRDGKYLIYNYGQNPVHLYVLPLADRKPVPFLTASFNTQEGQISPNGRWIAYISTESGRHEIYVEGFTLGKWQISVSGGELPRWRNDGKELFYDMGDTYYAVDVKTDGPSFSDGIPRTLFQVPTVASSATGGSPFVVTRDGQRLLVLEAVQQTVNAPIDVLVNWR